MYIYMCVCVPCTSVPISLYHPFIHVPVDQAVCVLCPPVPADRATNCHSGESIGSWNISMEAWNSWNSQRRTVVWRLVDHLEVVCKLFGHWTIGSFLVWTKPHQFHTVSRQASPGPMARCPPLLRRFPTRRTETMGFHQ